MEDERGPLTLPPQARLLGLAVDGLSGTGKTETLAAVARLAAADPEAWLCVLDPKSDLVERALSVIPEGRRVRVLNFGCPAGENPAVDPVEVVLAQQRQVGLGHRQLVVVPDDEERLRPLELGLELGGREAWVEGVGDRAQLHQRVKDHDVFRARPSPDHDRRPAAHAPRGEAPGCPGRLLL